MIKTTIVCFGDSLTAGYGVCAGEGYVDRLERDMPKFYPSILWNIANEGVDGDFAEGGLARLESDVLKRNPNVVITLFGSNDCSRYIKDRSSIAAFENAMRQTIAKIKAYNNKTGLNHCKPIPLLLTPPPVNESDVNGYSANYAVDAHADVIRRLADELNCPLADFNAYLKEEANDLNGCLQSDGLHLSEKGYDYMYDCVFSALSRLINYEGLLKDFDYYDEL